MCEATIRLFSRYVDIMARAHDEREKIIEEEEERCYPDEYVVMIDRGDEL